MSARPQIRGRVMRLRDMIPDDDIGGGPPKTPVPTNVKDVGTGGSEEKKKKFRVHAKTFFLTYADCDLSKEQVLEQLEARHGKLKKYAIGQEFHQMGNKHIHALVTFIRKVDSEDKNVFTLVNGTKHQKCKIVHANKKFKGWWEDKYYYTTKDMNYIDGGVDLYTTPKNFMNRRKDELGWRRLRRQRRQQSVFPMRLPHGEVYRFPPRYKQRHFLFIGPPDWGKTHWYNRVLTQDGTKHIKLFRPREGNHNMDSFNDQELCIFDDWFPKKIDVVDLCEQWFVDVEFAARYFNTEMPHGQRRVVVMLNNDAPPYMYEGWFLARFKIYRLVEGRWQRVDVRREPHTDLDMTYKQFSQDDIDAILKDFNNMQLDVTDDLLDIMKDVGVPEDRPMQFVDEKGRHD